MYMDFFTLNQSSSVHPVQCIYYMKQTLLYCLAVEVTDFHLTLK